MPSLIVLVVGALLVLAALALWLKLSKVRLDGTSRSFYGALRQWEQDADIADRYRVQWVLALGEQRDTEQLVRAWGLNSGDQPAWFGRWWYGAEGGVLVTPSVFFSKLPAVSIHLRLWQRLLRLLLKLRARRPLDAVLWVCPLEQLLDEEGLPTLAATARRKLLDVQQTLGLNLPVYLVISGLEALPGVTDLLERAPLESLHKALGWTNPRPVETPWQAEWIDQAFAQLANELANALSEIGALNGTLTPELYALPLAMQRLATPLQSLVTPVFEGIAPGEAPRLRGCYFSAAQLADSPAQDTDSLYAEPLMSEAPRQVFGAALWRQRIAPERGLAQPIARVVHIRRRWQRATLLAAVLLGCGWTGAMVWTWYGRTQDAQALVALLERPEATTDRRLTLLQNSLVHSWNMLSQAPRWQFSSLALPASWFSPLDAQLQALLRERLRQQLLAPMRQQLVQNLAALETPGAAGRVGGRSDTNEDDYLRQARTLVARATRLQTLESRYLLATGTGTTPLDDVFGLANDLAGTSYQPQQLRFQRYYNETLRPSANRPAQLFQLAAAKQETGARFLTLMRLWLDHFFGADDFASIAGYVASGLQNLQTGQRMSLQDLEDLKANIDELRRLVELTNVAWQQTTGKELVPGYQELLAQAAQTTLIGPDVVDQVDHYAQALKRTFRDRWIGQQSTRVGVLSEQGSGQLQLQNAVVKVNQAIEALMLQSFSQIALSSSNTLGNAGLAGLDSDSLTTALAYYDDYQRYLKQDVAELPPTYRRALLATAREAALTAIWQALTSKTLGHPQEPTSLSDAAFTLNVDKSSEMLAVLTQLGDSVQAEALRRVLNQRALQDVRRTKVAISALPIFGPPLAFEQWNGRPDFAARQYQATNAQDLKQTIEQQFRVASDALDAIRPALAWLGMQGDTLGATDRDQFDFLTELAQEMKKYNEQNPTSALALYEQLLTRDINAMDASNCRTTLGSAALPTGGGGLALLVRTQKTNAQNRCVQLQQDVAQQSWQRLSDYFQRYLAGRFPFSFEETAADANPDRVSAFLPLIDKEVPTALAAAKASPSPNGAAAIAFLESLQQAKAWLAPLLVGDKDATRGVDVEVRWRTDRQEERRADQLIDWSLHVDGRSISFPGNPVGQLRWSIGEPVKLVLRWATGSSQRPMADPRQAALAVYDTEAGWEYEGAWALLRFIRDHQAYERLPTQDLSDRPLAFQVPTRSAVPGETSMLAFIRVSLMGVGSKQPLMLTPLPTTAPLSPFTTPSFALPTASTLPNDIGP
ncbi:hypothetical protein SB14R_02695 [Pseudomonas oryzihabitans]|nr:hypothetical protein NS376_01800 [Pseudomonas psychrotolerans]KTT26721.1 hypothetical protein SB14R_02695 [Pseudomonas psychrotolerans]KTT59952.1 hypothetical protein SB8_02935 [Pseudomonas psychrotolerans]